MALEFVAAEYGGVYEYACKYASLGWRLLPVRGKRPTLKNWPVTATGDAATILKWFHESVSIGVATGLRSGIVVLDIDPRNGGDTTLCRLEQQLGALPHTVIARTGGGGNHLVFRWFDGAKSTSIKGIDFLADGKMFVVAPSIHPETGAMYQWESCPFEHRIAELPEAWKRRFSQRGEDHPKVESAVREGSRNAHRVIVKSGVRRLDHATC